MGPSCMRTHSHTHTGLLTDERKHVRVQTRKPLYITHTHTRTHKNIVNTYKNAKVRLCKIMVRDLCVYLFFHSDQTYLLAGQKASR